MLGVAGGILLAVGVVSLFRPLPFHPHFLFSPISLGLGASMFTYGTHLAWRARAVKGIPAPDNREEQRLAAVSTTLGAIAVILSLFWGTADFADALGRGRADALAHQLNKRPSVAIYAQQRRNNLDVDGVRETRLDGTDSAYRFRYDGLRLLMRSGDNYFLLPEGWTPQGGTAIILKDDPTWTLVLARGKAEGDKSC
jgi:hypothetical protein